jgi:hypothetical protein
VAMNSQNQKNTIQMNLTVRLKSLRSEAVYLGVPQMSGCPRMIMSAHRRTPLRAVHAYTMCGGRTLEVVVRDMSPGRCGGRGRAHFRQSRDRCGETISPHGPHGQVTGDTWRRSCTKGRGDVRGGGAAPAGGKIADTHSNSQSIPRFSGCP